MLPPPLADFLRARRDYCNARFNAARHRWQRLDASDFALFLRDQLGPLATSLNEKKPDHVSLVLDLAYENGLQLVAEKLGGLSARSQVINVLWSDLLPRFTDVLASEPRRVLAALSNAALNITNTNGARSDQWLARLAELGPRCASADELLGVAQILAWRAGLSHYRASALAVANTLPAALALEAVNAPADAAWPEVYAAHTRDPWFGYDANRQPLTIRNSIQRIGSFRGFGGLFLVPPTVERTGEDLLIRSGEDAWILLADAFGSTFHRASPDEIKKARLCDEVPKKLQAGWQLPAGHNASSFAVAGSVCVLTSAQSHALQIGPVSTSP